MTMTFLGASAAHRCFSIAELTSRIVNVENFFFPGDLLPVALTCRAFLEPTLNSMWASMETLTPLLRLFPSNVVGWNGVRWTFIRAPTGDDWARVEYYGRRIECLDVSADDPGANENILKNLTSHHRDSWILPNLLNFTWRIVDDDLFLYARLFLGPRTESFDFCPDARISLSGLHQIMQFLMQECPNLNSLSTHRYESSPEGVPDMSDEQIEVLGHDLSEWIMKTATINAFHHGTWGVKIEDKAIQHLAHLPNLRHLSLESNDLDVVMRNNATAEIFPEIVCLTADVQHHESLALLVGRIKSSSLGRFYIQSTTLIPFNSLAAATIAFESHNSAKSLTYLSLSFASQWVEIPIGERDQYRLGFDTLRPLLSLPHVRYFMIQSPYVDPDDQLLIQIGQSWPCLTNLVIEPKCQPVSDMMTTTSRASSVTMEGIRALLEGCPWLVRVVSSFRAVSIHSSSPLPPAILNRENHISFDFMSSDIDGADTQPLATAFMNLGLDRVEINSTDPWQFYDPSLSAHAAGMDLHVYITEIRARAFFWKEVSEIANRELDVHNVHSPVSERVEL